MSLLSADYGTTATALVWSIFLMSKQHSHVQNKLEKGLSQYDQQHLSVE